MPNAPKPMDGVMRQQWMHDISEDGKPSGQFGLEVAFEQDNPDGPWTTHLYPLNEPDRRMNRGHTTAIVITGVSQTRQRALTELINNEGGMGFSERTRILSLLAEDPDLDWAA